MKDPSTALGKTYPDFSETTVLMKIKILFKDMLADLSCRAQSRQIFT